MSDLNNQFGLVYKVMLESVLDNYNINYVGLQLMYTHKDKWWINLTMGRSKVY